MTPWRHYHRGGGRRQASASRGPAAKFLIEGFHVIAFLEIISGIRLPGGDGKPREGPDAPGRRSRAIRPGRKSLRGEAAQGSGPGSVAGWT